MKKNIAEVEKAGAALLKALAVALAQAKRLQKEVRKLDADTVKAGNKPMGEATRTVHLAIEDDAAYAASFVIHEENDGLLAHLEETVQGVKDSLSALKPLKVKLPQLEKAKKLDAVVAKKAKEAEAKAKKALALEEKLKAKALATAQKSVSNALVDAMVPSVPSLDTPSTPTSQV